MGSGRPILYVGSGKDDEMARRLLEREGFRFDVRNAPSFYQVAYGTPVLFALSNRFEGIEGIRIFIENARILGHSKAAIA